MRGVEQRQAERYPTEEERGQATIREQEKDSRRRRLEAQAQDRRRRWDN